MPRTYVDNASNRSLGRVGMEVGSMVVSKGSGGGGSYYKSGGEKSYSRDSGGNSCRSGERSDSYRSDSRSSYNRGNDGGSYGSGDSYRYGGGDSYRSDYRSNNRSRDSYRSRDNCKSEGRSSYYSEDGGDTYSYDDGNSYSRGYGGVIDSYRYEDRSYNGDNDRDCFRHDGGKSRDTRSGSYRSDCRTTSDESYSSGTSTKTYVDNAQNRKLGRVGMPHGSMINSGKETSHASSVASTPKTYVDNQRNRKLGRVGMRLGSVVISKDASLDYSHDSGIGASPASNLEKSPKSKVYKDNKLNRSLGRVGKPLGYTVSSNTSHTSKSASSGSTRTYVDNTLNRSLGRVGKTLGSMPVSNISRQSKQAQEIIKNIQDDTYDEYRDRTNHDQMALDTALSLVNRKLEELHWREETRERKAPKTSRSLIKDYSDQKINFEKIELRRKIGHGGFGDVHFAKWQGSVVAVKKLRVDRVSKKRLWEFTDEVLTFCELDHPNIVKFIGACVITPRLAIVMEYMQMSLFDGLYMKEDVDFSEDERIEILRQTFAGMDYLHNNKMAHCDIKSQNILLDYTAGETCVAKITDFGLTMIKSNTESSTSGAGELVRNIGTPRYSAPEVLRGEYLSVRDMLKSDVYSLSLIIFEVLYQQEPFYNLSYSQLRRQIGENGVTPEIPQNIRVDYRVDNMMRKCWSFYPSQRPSMKSVHDMFKLQQRLYVK